MRGSSDLELVPARRLVTAPVDVVFALAPGDRPLVTAGDSVVIGAPIAERLRDSRLDEIIIADPADAHVDGVPSDTSSATEDTSGEQPDDSDGGIE